MDTFIQKLAIVGNHVFYKKRWTQRLLAISEKKYVYSPSKHQDFNEKLSECSNNIIPRNVLQNICSEEDLDSLFEEKVDQLHFEKSEIEMNTKESMEIFNYLPECNSDYPYVFNLHNLSEKKRMIFAFKQRLNVLHVVRYLFYIHPDYYELPKQTIGLMEKEIWKFAEGMCNFTILSTSMNTKNCVRIAQFHLSWILSHFRKMVQTSNQLRDHHMLLFPRLLFKGSNSYSTFLSQFPGNLIGM